MPGDAWCLLRSKEVLIPWDLSYRWQCATMWVLLSNPDPLQEQVFSTAESSLQPQHINNFQLKWIYVSFGVHPLSSCFQSEERPLLFAERRQQINGFCDCPSAQFTKFSTHFLRVSERIHHSASISPSALVILFFSFWHIGGWTQDLTYANQIPSPTPVLYPQTSICVCVWVWMECTRGELYAQ